MKKTVLAVVMGVGLVLASVVPGAASTILQFTESGFTSPFTFADNGTTTTLTAATPVNVIFDPSFCLVPGCGGATNGLYALALNATSVGPATLVAGAISEAFTGTISLTNGVVNLLTVHFTDLVEGSQGGSSPTLEASQPPDLFSGSSTVFDPADFGVPRGFALSFSNLSAGGLGIDGTTIRGGTADGTGTFSVTPVPEPASLFLFGVGLMGLAPLRRRVRPS